MSHIYFEKLDYSDVYEKYNVRTLRDHIVLGTIEWYEKWYQYCYFPFDNTVYSQDCMMDIVEFIKRMKKPVLRRN